MNILNYEIMFVKKIQREKILNTLGMAKETKKSWLLHCSTLCRNCIHSLLAKQTMICAMLKLHEWILWSRLYHDTIKLVSPIVSSTITLTLLILCLVMLMTSKVPIGQASAEVLLLHFYGPSGDCQNDCHSLH